MRQRLKQLAARPLAAAYLLAVLLWLAFAAFGAAKSGLYTLRGLGGDCVLSADQLQLVSLVDQEPGEGVPEGEWLVSSDSDPQLRWQCGGRYLENVTLEMESLWPTGAVVLYYRLPGQADFSATQMVYAQTQGDGRYTFRLGGIRAEEIRVDPASQGGVVLRVESLSCTTLGWSRLIPSWQQLALLLGLPPVAAALWRLAAAFVGKKKD